MNKNINIINNDFSGSEEIIVDTNILLYLFGPFNYNDFNYSVFLEKARNKDISLYVSDIILSEFVNVNTRLGYYLYLKENKLTAKNCDYKKYYRETTNFREIYELSLEIIEQEILKEMTLLIFDNQIIENFSSYTLLDFGDELIYRQAKILDYSIVSHDKDFRQLNSGVKIYHT